MKINAKIKDATAFPLFDYKKTPDVPWTTFSDDLADPRYTGRTGLGIDCGRSGLVVIDVDMHGDVDGIAKWLEIQSIYNIPSTFTVATPNGGFHYYFSNEGKEVRNSASKIGAGIDVRGNGGYIIAPGSKIKIDGIIKEYTVLSDEVIAPLPNALRELATASKDKKAKIFKDDAVDPQGEILITQEVFNQSAMSLLTAEAGKRNTVLNAISYDLTQKGATIDYLQNRILPLAISIGLSENESLKTIKSAYEAATKKVEKAVASPFDSPNGFYTDAVLSTRFGKVLRDENWRYLNGVSIWRRYNPKIGIWQEVTIEDVMERTKQWCFAEVSRAVEDKDADRIKASMRCLSKSVINSIVDLVRLECKVQPDEFDKEPYLITCENGVIDLRNAEIKEFSPDFMLTKRIPIPYNVNVKSLYLDKILEALPDDAVEWFISMSGQALTGEQPSSDRMFFMNGVGANGKSTLLNLLSATAGEFGGFPAQNSLIRQRGNDGYNLIMYKGLHQAIVEEMPDKQLDTVRLKALTGTEKITARGLYQNNETFTLKCTIWVSCNILPQVLEYDNGTWRRIALIPFTKVYKRSKKEITHSYHRLGDDNVRKAALHDRDTHIEFFARRVQAAKEWYSRGAVDMNLPTSVQEATLDWQLKGDNIRSWFKETIIKEDSTENNFVLIEDLRDSYNRWLVEHGYSAISHKSFLDRFSNHSVYLDNDLKVVRGRVTKLSHSEWADPQQKKDLSYTPRDPGLTPTHIKHIAFNIENK